MLWLGPMEMSAVFAAHDGHELSLAPLKMEPAQNVFLRVGQIVLDKPF